MLLNPLNLIQNNPLADTRATTKTWQVGQLLHALTLSRNQQGTIDLQIGQEKIQAQISTKQNFQIGERLVVEVMKTDREAVLRVVERQMPPSSKHLIGQLLRQSLPKARLTEFLSRLDQIVVTEKQSNSATFPTRVAQQLKQLIEIIPRDNNVKTSNGLKQMLLQSGTFMETRLAKLVSDSTPSPVIKQLVNQDLKANLLRLVAVIDDSLPTKPPAIADASIRPQPARQPVSGKQQVAVSMTNEEIATQDMSRLFELRQLTEAAIAKIQLNQGNSIATQEQTLPTWVIDLPIKDGDHTALMQIRIRQEHTSKRDDENTQRWHLSLSFELEGLGNIGVRVIYFNDEISSSIWAENQSTYNAIEQNLPSLERRMRQAGLQVASIQCYPGNMSTDENADKTVQSLLSISL